MSDKPISPLRQRMIDDMTARRVKEKVQKDYVRHFLVEAGMLSSGGRCMLFEQIGEAPSAQRLSPGVDEHLGWK